MKNIEKIFAVFVLAVLLAPCLAFADGGIVLFDPYSDRWDYADETNQQAFINYDQGIEKMILSVGAGDLQAGKAMWIFPVPADPDKVSVDVVAQLPKLQGEEISEKARSNLDDAGRWLAASQIYTLPFAFLSRNTLSASGPPQGASLSTGGGSLKNALVPDVVVFEHVEKEGITSEIVTARTVQGFNEYFSKKGLQINSTSIPVLQNYIGKKYSFVVSWMEQKELFLTDDDIEKILSKGHYPRLSFSGGKPSEAENQAYKLVQKLDDKYPGFNEKMREPANDWKYALSPDELNDLKQGVKDHPEILQLLGKNQKGVFVTFPAEKIYFPLMPTSVYGSKIVPAQIRVLGHVTPDVFPDIKSFTKTEYFRDKSAQLIDVRYNGFYNGVTEDVKYTKIEINAPSKYFTDDLWMENSAPLRTYYQSFIADQALPEFAILLVLCSAITGLLAGWLLFGEWRNWEGVKKFGLIGLANCFTILGLIAVILPAKTAKDLQDAASLMKSVKEKGYYWRRRISLGIMIVDFPFLLVSILMLFFVIPQEFSHWYAYSDSFLGMFISPLVLMTLVPIIIFLPAVLLGGRIKEGDKQLFEELKQKNYSSWTFQPKDRRKIRFIVLYSIFFLIISWIIVKLLVLSVGGHIINPGNFGTKF